MKLEQSAGTRRRLNPTWRVLLVVFSLSAALHAYSWHVNPGRPSLANDVVTGWYGGAADQINYARQARALADGKLPGIYWDYDHRRARPDRPPNAELADYAYGLGYPILGAPFVKLGLRRDPFVIPDTVAFGLIICLASLLARRFLSDAAALVFAGVLAVASPVLRLTVVPWNTTLTIIAVLVARVRDLHRTSNAARRPRATPAPHRLPNPRRDRHETDGSLPSPSSSWPWPASATSGVAARHRL